jgi:hypothetical protein
MPTAPLPSQLRVHQGVPTDRNPISQRLSSNGTPEWRARAISGRVPTERCYSAVLGRGHPQGRRIQERTRRTRTVSQEKVTSSEMCRVGVHVSSIPRLLGALGTALRRSVENEKWAATFPSGRGRRVSSSRNSSSAALTGPERVVCGPGVAVGGSAHATAIMLHGLPSLRHRGVRSGPECVMWQHGALCLRGPDVAVSRGARRWCSRAPRRGLPSSHRRGEGKESGPERVVRRPASPGDLKASERNQ